MIANSRMLRACALAVLLSTVSCATPSLDDDPTRSAGLYLRVCSACHGEKGNGRSLASFALGTSPRDFTTEEARTHLSREYMIAIVRDGRPHTAMVGRSTRLSLAEIEGAVDFIRTAFMPPEPGSALARGRDLYRKSCAVCHGDRGQGGIARTARPAAPPISAARASPGLTADRFIDAIARQPHAAGPPASGVELTSAESQAIAAYVRTTFIEAVAGRKDAGDRKAR